MALHALHIISSTCDTHELVLMFLDRTELAHLEIDEYLTRYS